MRNFEKSSRILEFDKILNMLASVAFTEGAKKRAISLQPSSNVDTVKKRQEFTSNAKKCAK